MFKPTDLPHIRAELLAASQETHWDLSDADLHRLSTAELFWVSADTTDLAMHASTTLPSYELQPEDLPSPSGLIVFERPIADFPGHTYETCHAVAAAWGRIDRSISLDGGKTWGGENWITIYSDTARNLASASPQWLAEVSGSVPEKLDVGQVRHHLQLQRPTLSDGGEVFAHFGTSEDVQAPPNEDEFARGIISAMKTIRAAWILMQQPITRSENAHFDRPSRRRLQRAGIDPSPVRVISLRRPRDVSAGSESDREYHHRWIVRGHWRQQWYPARQVHRPVWIAPHIKGPEGAPFIGGEKVHAWRR